MLEEIKPPNDAEITEALKAFKGKNNPPQTGAVNPSATQQTSKIEVGGVQFETDSYKAVKFYNQTNTPKIVKLVMKLSGGAVKEEKQAYWVLFGFVVLAIAVSLFLFFGGTKKTTLLPINIQDIDQSQFIQFNK